jgi:hypothetical protein
METRGVRQPRNPSSSGQRPPISGVLQPILKNKREDSLGGPDLDYDLYNSLLADKRKTLEKDRENLRPLGRRDGSTLKSKMSSVDRVQFLEQELYAERNNSRLLEMKVEELEEKLENNKDEYKRNLEIFSSQIKNYKSLQTEILRMKSHDESRELEVEELRVELEEYRNTAKAALEFVIKTFEIVSLLPEQVEVDTGSHDIIDFSFEEKRASLLPKNIFLEKKIIKFLEANESFVKKFQLENLLMKIIEEYENKKTQGSHYTSPKIRRSSSKKRKTKEQKTSPQHRSPKLRKLVESFNGNDQSSLDRSGEQQTEKNNFSSNTKSQQSSSGGKNNNYSININLVVNDNSDSLISDNNQSVQAAGRPPFQNFIKFFEKELGCDNDMSDSSIIMADSLIYSPSDRSSKITEGTFGPPEGKRPLQIADKTEIVVSKFRFEKMKAEDIELTIGDKIKVISKDPSGWWYGQNLTTSQIGCFPSNFVRPL